jgi:hypothetical protein
MASPSDTESSFFDEAGGDSGGEPSADGVVKVKVEDDDDDDAFV